MSDPIYPTEPDDIESTGSLPATAAHAPHVAQVSGYDYAHQKEWRIESGESQSPIDICSADTIPAEQTPDENDEIVMHVSSEGATVIDNGQTVQVVPVKSTATIRGRHFTLAQAHFHTPAEHTIDGKRYPIEGHFVFKAQDGRLAVIAVLYREGAENEQFAAILRTARRNAPASLDTFNAAALVPPSADCYYHYLGSLTTPPLTEQVEWYVLDSVVDLSREDISAFEQWYPFNARDTQPLNGRPLLKYDLCAAHGKLVS